MESEDQIAAIAADVKAAGATFLRGEPSNPALLPMLSRAQGRRIELLRHARAKTGLPIVTEIMSASHMVLFEDVDVIQVGARNMQNFELLKELGKCDKPILLKRGAGQYHRGVADERGIYHGLPGNEKVSSANGASAPSRP